MNKPKRYWAEARPLLAIHEFIVDDSAVGTMYIVPAVFIPMILAGISEIFWDGGLVTATGIITFVVMVALPLIPFLSGLRKVNNYSDRRKAKGSRDLIREILSLPKEDLRNFPPNLVETLSKNIPMDERLKINERLEGILSEIYKRDKLLYEAMQRSIPTEGIIASLDDRLAGLTTETNTIRELL